MPDIQASDPYQRARDLRETVGRIRDLVYRFGVPGDSNAVSDFLTEIHTICCDSVNNDIAREQAAPVPGLAQAWSPNRLSLAAGKATSNIVTTAKHLRKLMTSGGATEASMIVRPDIHDAVMAVVNAAGPFDPVPGTKGAWACARCGPCGPDDGAPYASVCRHATEPVSCCYTTTSESPRLTQGPVLTYCGDITCALVVICKACHGAITSKPAHQWWPRGLRNTPKAHGYSDHSWGCCDKAARPKDLGEYTSCGGWRSCDLCRVWRNQVHAGVSMVGRYPVIAVQEDSHADA